MLHPGRVWLRMVLIENNPVRADSPRWYQFRQLSDKYPPYEQVKRASYCSRPPPKLRRGAAAASFVITSMGPRQIAGIGLKPHQPSAQDVTDSKRQNGKKQCCSLLQGPARALSGGRACKPLCQKFRLAWRSSMSQAANPVGNSLTPTYTPGGLRIQCLSPPRGPCTLSVGTSTLLSRLPLTLTLLIPRLATKPRRIIAILTSTLPTR